MCVINLIREMSMKEKGEGPERGWEWSQTVVKLFKA